jgi:hydrogenase-4 component B
MMNALLFLLILSLTFLVFLVPKNYKYYYTLFLLGGAVTLCSVWSFKVLSESGQLPENILEIPILQNSIILTIDRLSAFFIVVVNITVLVGFLYAREYLKPYYQSKNTIAPVNVY